MDEIAISVAAKIAEYLVAPFARPFTYLWNYKTNLENLKNEVKKLEAKREAVERLIKVGEEPLPDVKLWEENVKNVIDKASELINEDNTEQANKQCCKGFSSTNLLKCYQRSKKAAGKLKTDVVGLEQEAAQFKEVSSRTNVPEETWIQSNKVYKAFESRTSVLKNIIDALRNHDVNMVGIYGMGGIGKTTLAKEVARQAKQDNLFDEIVFVEVSKTQDTSKIQHEIGEKLGLKFHEKTDNGRARTLYQHLKNEVTVSGGVDNSEGKKKENKILIILDNVWERIDLETVGIPLRGDCKGLKLLLTTRNSDVLTNQMNSQCNFPIDALHETEAWSLFKSIAGMCVDSPDLKSIAQEVTKECGGMTIAIVTIARALKNKEECVWRNTLEELKKPTSESFEGMTKEVYTSIKLSYDYLDTTKLKEIFLLCSRMGRTYDASIQDLFRYGLGLGLFENFNTVEEALCKVKYLVKTLKENSLLIDAPNVINEYDNYYGIPDDEKFAMHDVIYYVARSIACGKGNVCIVIDDVIPRFWAKKNKLEDCTSITLRDIGEFPKDLRLVCPQLKFFYMKTKGSFSRIPDDFFIEMPVLQVLHLINMNLSPLPTSLSHLINLQTLCLDECNLGDIAVIGKLEKLEILSFRGSVIEKLSEEMRQLTSIRLLDLTNFSALKIIPPNVLSCFTRLEALYMYNTSIKWEVGTNIGRRNAGLDELKRLCDGLTTLEICIPEAKMSEDLLFSQLERYKISIGFDYNWKCPPKSSRTLRFKIKSNDNVDGVISQLKGIKELELFGKRRYGSMHSVSCDALFSLESLVLKDLNLEKICNGPLLTDSFCQLKTIRVDECNKLTNIFSFSTNRVLPQLQEIQVSSCENMEEIFAIEIEDDVNSTQVIHDQIQFSQLHSVTLNDLPLLKSFCHRVKTASPLQLTSNTEDKVDIPKLLFNDEKVVFPNLQNLEISGITDVEKIWHNLPLIMSSCVQNLTKLNVSGCHNLKELFSSSTVIIVESREEDRRDTISFPKLNYLEMGDLTKLTRLWSGYYLEFPSLKEFFIYDCPELKTFIFDEKVYVLI